MGERARTYRSRTRPVKHEASAHLSVSYLLLADDNEDMRLMLRELFRASGHEVSMAADGVEALASIAAREPDLVILDHSMPNMSGLEVCRRLKQNPFTSRVPVMMLTAQSGVESKVEGFAAGADDYIAKPFSPRELVARVRGILRRTVRTPVAAPQPSVPPGTAPVFMLDEERRQIRFYGRTLELSRYEYGILRLLVRKPGRVFTRDELLTQVWEDGSGSLDRTVDAHIKTLRAKLKAVAPQTEPIRTSRGSGYALAEDLPPS